MFNFSSIKIKQIFFHLLPALLLTVTAVLFTYWYTTTSIPPAAIIRPTIFACGLVIILYFVIHRLIANQQTTSLLLAIFVSGFYMMEELFYLTIFVSAFISFAGWLIIRIVKKKIQSSHISLFLHLTSYTLALIVLLQFISPFRMVNWIEYQNAIVSTKNDLPQTGQAVSNKPDIYYIVLDAYGRADALQEYYGYDNSEFISYLEKTGFFVPAEVYSNYPATTLSVPSTLNMDYVNNITDGLESSHFWWLMKPYVAESRLQLFLEQQGYQSIFVASDWYITDNRDAKNYFAPYPSRLNEFEGYMLSTTPLRIIKPLIKKFVKIPSYDSSSYDTHREYIVYSLKTLGKISKIQGPKFVFSHIVTPHPPFVFDSDGNPIVPDYSFSFKDGTAYPGTDEEYQLGYIGQLQYTNKLLKETINTILSQSQTPPIIIIQADHGPRMLSADETPQNICIKERFAIFAAYYLPGLEKNPFPNEITSVNIFRIILNEYFFTNLEILENKAYVPIDRLSIYKTEPVQGLSQRGCN